MPCPTCRSVEFHIKDPDDPYETMDFTIHGGTPVFQEAEGGHPELTGESQVHCNRCTWKGTISELK